MQYWLMKSEASCYNIDDLKADKITPWTEIRNYQARNYMREMEIGDRVLFYHSNGGKETGVVGEMKVVTSYYPDPTQFDSNSDYYDPKSTTDKPQWDCVDVRFVKKFKNPIYLSELKSKKEYQDMVVVRPGNRLSVTPITKKHYDLLIKAGT